MNQPQTNPIMIALTLLCGALLTAFLVLFFFFHAPLQRENKKLKRDLAYYDSTYLSKQGWTSFGGDKGISYSLRSWDSGQNWYAVEMNLDSTPSTLKILGEADTIYPNLLQHLAGIDALTDYVSKNGAIGSKPISEKEINLMEGAGFTVTKNKN